MQRKPAMPNVSKRVKHILNKSDGSRAFEECWELARPALARPVLARPALARPVLARPELARPALAL